MKRNLMQRMLVFISFIVFAPSILAADRYTLDSKHTHVLWHVSHFGFSHPSGKWMAEGTIEVDESNPQNSKVDATVHVADVITGIKELDKHIKEKLLLDTSRFPTATFVSNKIILSGKNRAKVHGTLTLHGVSKPLVLDVTLNKMGVSPITDKKTLGFTAHAHLKRSDYGITNLLPGVSDEVKLDIEVEAFKES